MGCAYAILNNMNNLTLLIPAKHESGSLPLVLNELKIYNLKILIVMEKEDKETIDAIKDYDVEILYQKFKGYGSALIEGIGHINTDFMCIFNADGSFNPIELNNMYESTENFDFIFGTRYQKNCSSEDDTFVTYVGNKIFSFIGKIFFGLETTDILYTYILGKTSYFKELDLKENDFKICVEIPINIKFKNFSYTNNNSNERARFKGRKKVNEFVDGFKILIYLLKRFFKF